MKVSRKRLIQKTIRGCCKHVLMDQFNDCFDLRNKKGLKLSDKNKQCTCKIYKY